MAMTQDAVNSKLNMAQLYHSINKNYPHRAKMIKSILEKKIVINQVIPASTFLHSSHPDLTECTILHMAAIKRDAEIFRILLDNGANFTMQNQSGCTVIHYLFNRETGDSRNELINSVLSAHVRFENSRNPCDSNGISHFHTACMVNNIKAVQFFLEHSVSVHQIVSTDSLRFAGYSPIHFAAEGCSIEAIKLLLEHHATISVKDAQGRTPLHVFLQQRIRLFESLREDETDASKLIKEKIALMDEATDLLLHNNETDDVGLSLMHVACTMENSSVAEYFVERVTDINHCVKFDSPVWPGYTALHFAAHCDMKIFQMLVQKGAVIETKNAEGMTPLDICFKKGNHVDLLTILISKIEWETAKLTDKTTLIELAANMCEPLQFRNYLQTTIDNINTQVVENPPFWIGFTPLHFAVLVSTDINTELIQSCLDLGAGVTIQDVHGWTPIHLAFRLNKIELTILLLKNYQGTEDLIDNEGLSLHNIVQKLVRLPSAFNVYHVLTRWYKDEIFEEVGSTWLHAAIYSGDADLLNLRLNYKPKPDVDAVVTCNNPNIFWSRYFGYTPLHLAIQQSSNAEIIYTLLKNGADIFAARPDGMTPLYGILKDVSNDFHLLHRFVWQLEELDDFRQRERNLKVHLKNTSGITMLHVACRTFDVDAVTGSIQAGVDVNARVKKDCPIWSEYTPLHVLLWYSVYIQQPQVYENFLQVLGFLLIEGADVTAVIGEGDTPVHLCFERCINDMSDRNFACLSLLIDHHRDFRFNPVNAKGISHFHAACLANNVKAVDKFLDHGVDESQPIDYFAENVAGDSPLHLALRRIADTDDHLKIIDLLLLYEADVLAQNSYGCTVLHTAARDYSWNIKLLEKLVSRTAGVNPSNIFGETPIELLLKADGIALPAMDVLLSTGCHFNSSNHITEEGYLSMIINDKYHKTAQLEIFERVMKASDLSNIDEIGHTALHNIVTTCVPNSIIIDYAEVINRFERLGIDLDHRDKKGKTALHLASQFRNTQAVDALIDAGVDVNIADFRNKTALSYALEFCNPDKYRDDSIIKALVVHIRKLQLLGFDVHDLDRSLLEENSLNAIFNCGKLLTDREKIRKIVVDKQPLLVLDDIMLETEALTAYPFTLDSKRNEVEKSLKSLTEDFRELKSVIMFQYRIALKGVIA